MDALQHHEHSAAVFRFFDPFLRLLGVIATDLVPAVTPPRLAEFSSHKLSFKTAVFSLQTQMCCWELGKSHDANRLMLPSVKSSSSEKKSSSSYNPANTHINY